MKSRSALILGGAALLALAALSLFVLRPSGPSPSADRAAPERDEHAATVHADARPAAKAPAPHELGAGTGGAAELPLLADELRDTTLRTAVAPVLGCLAGSRMNSDGMDRAMHARLHVAPNGQGRIGVVDVELVGAAGAPPAFRTCVVDALLKLELDLPAGTDGLVITPPFAGTST